MNALPAPATVTTPDATGAYYEYGAHVVDWTPSGAAPVIWLSPATRLVEGVAIRGGIPLCFPWFGPGRAGDRTPNHGFARTATWRVASVHGPTVVLELTDVDVDLPEDWRHHFVARYTVTMGSRLQVSLSVENHDDEPFELEAALHTYLHVGDVRQVEVRGLDHVEYVDKVDGAARRTQDGDLRFEGETDRVYASTRTVEVVDPVLERTLVVESDGATRTVVWNPGEEKAAGMDDVAEWDRFCCVEAALALDGTVTLEPGASHTLTQRIALA